jgi:hypothetical protein
MRLLLEDIEAVLKIVLDLAVLVPFIVNLVYELNNNSGTIQGQKILTRAGYLSLTIFVFLTSANIVLTRAGMIISLKIDFDAKATFDKRLNAALKKKNEELIAEFKPTLDEQKRLVGESTAELTARVSAATSSLNASLLDNGDRVARNMVQVGNEIEYADIPLSAFMIKLDVPELAPKLRHWMPELSKEDQKTELLLQAREQKPCQNAWLDLSLKVTSGSKECERLMKERMFWIWTRPIQKYFDPDHNLSITLKIRFQSFFVQLVSDTCNFGIPPSNYNCINREIGIANIRSDVAMYDDDSKLYLNNSSPSVITWATNGTMDKAFSEVGVKEQDIEFAELEVRVCDKKASEESSGVVQNHLAKFPSHSSLKITTYGFPSDKQKAIGVTRNLPMQLGYDFKPAHSTPDGDGCLLISYSH